LLLPAELEPYKTPPFNIDSFMTDEKNVLESTYSLIGDASIENSIDSLKDK
jgi:hypothetical protein